MNGPRTGTNRHSSSRQQRRQVTATGTHFLSQFIGHSFTNLPQERSRTTRTICTLVNYSARPGALRLELP